VSKAKHAYQHSKMTSTKLIITAEVTQPNTRQGICNNVDFVISTLGITRQRDKLTYQNVDYQANLNLLREAERVG